MHQKSLNPAQQKAVMTTEGRILILAGAGSGKTLVLTSRIAHLIQDKGVRPEEILGLTFTNKAAREMKNRLSHMIGERKGALVTLSTFHSFCLAILRKEIEALGFTRDFTLWDSQDVERVIRTMARDILDQKGGIPSLAPTFAVIHRARSQCCNPEELKEAYWHGDFAKQIYMRLQYAFRAFNALDFDGLLTETVRLFEKRGDILERVQEKCRYVMIDEYQDTNPIQYRLASLLSQKSGNLCAVGDDDQSIYGWRGATLENILYFSEGKECEIIKLEENFRSTEVILEAAHAVIMKNCKRHDKKLWSQKGRGEPIEIFHAPSSDEEATAIAARLVFLKEKLSYPWSSFAVLYRSNSLAQLVEMALQKSRWRSEKGMGGMVQGVPYQVFGGGEFFDRKEIKDLAAYLRYVINPKDDISLLRIINYPRRGIGEVTLDRLTSYNRQNNLPLEIVLSKVVKGEIDLSLGEKALGSLRAFLHFAEAARSKMNALSPSAYMQWLIDEIDYAKAIDEEFASDKMREWKRKNIEEFVLFLASSVGNWHDILSALHLGEDPHYLTAETAKDKVSLMTIHTSKGLEFPVLFLMGMEDHIIPHERSLAEGEGVEEERRLMYVAMTRAKERLVLSMARKRKRLGGEAPSQPSRFLFDIPKECLRSARWDDLIF